jgi:hypothetical protein
MVPIHLQARFNLDGRGIGRGRTEPNMLRNYNRHNAPDESQGILEYDVAGSDSRLKYLRP